MNQRSRLDRLARGVQDLEPDHDAVTEAMAEFKRTGRLPRDIKTARAVTQWAETGVPPSVASLSQVERLCLYVGEPKPPPPAKDPVMEGIYLDAVYGDELERLLARSMLAIFAKTGHDPSQPIWAKFGWPPPTMTCSSMALTLAGFPTSFVQPEHRRRSKLLAEKLVAYCSLHSATEAERKVFVDAATAFYETGRLPADAGMVDAVLWDVELAAYLDLCQHGMDQTRLITALRAYWCVPARDRAAALAEVQAAVLAGPGPCNPDHPGPRQWLRELLLHFIRKFMDAVEPMA